MALRPMDRPFLETCAIISAKTKKVLQVWQKNGRSLESLPGRAQNILKCFRAMEHRLLAGDFRASEDEIKVVNELAAWLIYTWHELRGTPVPKTAWTEGYEQSQEKR